MRRANDTGRKLIAASMLAANLLFVIAGCGNSGAVSIVDEPSGKLVKTVLLYTESATPYRGNGAYPLDHLYVLNKGSSYFNIGVE